MTEPYRPDGDRFHVTVEIDDDYADGVDVADMVRAVEATLLHADVGAARVTVAITDDQTVRALNARYRAIDAPTDVLSFSAVEPAGHSTVDSAPVEFVLPPELEDEMGDYLGDIVIAYDYAVRQAERYGNTVGAELRLLAVHGALHLLGYDHDTPHARARMWAIQDAVLTEFGDQPLSGRVYDD